MVLVVVAAVEVEAGGPKEVAAAVEIVCCCDDIPVAGVFVESENDPEVVPNPIEVLVLKPVKPPDDEAAAEPEVNAVVAAEEAVGLKTGKVRVDPVKLVVAAEVVVVAPGVEALVVVVTVENKVVVEAVPKPDLEAGVEKKDADVDAEG